jgi:hypothetical protein
VEAWGAAEGTASPSGGTESGAGRLDAWTRAEGEDRGSRIGGRVACGSCWTLRKPIPDVNKNRISGRKTGYQGYGRTNPQPFSIPVPVYSIPFSVPFPYFPEKTKTNGKKRYI